MRSVLISIKPKWCELIATGEKTIEVRKTKPKLDTPFKVYIYCTKGKTMWSGNVGDYGTLSTIGNGKVIGEFVCDTFVVDKTFGHDVLFNAAACMSDTEVSAYCLNAEMFGWHITDLHIYDQPKLLSNFRSPCKEYTKDSPQCGCCDYYHTMGEYPAECACDGVKPIIRPPQSWCYVKEVV